jgi:AcrR family transcriptional regulator
MSDLPDSAPRRPRADAERNRARVLEEARRLFADQGGAATLEAVARAAGVGIGTLYRHFPTREQLVAEVYRADAERLANAARFLSEAQPTPKEALRSWLRLFIELLGTRRGLAELLATPPVARAEAPVVPGGDARAIVVAAVAMLVERVPREAGGAAPGDPVDLLLALIGVANASRGSGWEDRAWHLADILVAGLGS